MTERDRETSAGAGARTFSRRRWLRVGIGGSIALGVGGALAWNVSGYSVPARIASRLVALSPKEYLVVEAAASSILRRDADDLPTPEELDVALAIDDLVAQLDPANRADLRRLLHLLEHALPMLGGHVTRFTRLDQEGRDDVLRAMSESGTLLLRGGFSALKSLCAMAYFSSPRTWGAIGYDGPLVDRPAEGWVAASQLGRRRGGAP
ncbi:MAG: gluconate 2-dehydrogenase subunit 3 family protein [Myxococcota bacterium]|nr:gluconate 2-dehydrogenase subunit 3 family protein [Myxococcota bacterium]